MTFAHGIANNFEKFQKKYFNTSSSLFTSSSLPECFSDTDLITNAEFTRNIKAAFIFMKAHAPPFYALVLAMNKKIRATDECKGAQANYINHTIDIGEVYFRNTPEKLASTIIHETVHFCQYELGKNTFSTRFETYEAELEAYKMEIAFEREVGTPEAMANIEWLEKQRGTHNVRYKF